MRRKSFYVNLWQNKPNLSINVSSSLATNRDDYDGATSKGRGGSHEAKQSLAEYASLYREYEHIDKCIKEGNYEPELERRRDDLTRELAAREEHIRRVSCRHWLQLYNLFYRNTNAY